MPLRDASGHRPGRSSRTELCEGSARRHPGFRQCRIDRGAAVRRSRHAIIAVSDSTGGVKSEAGLDPKAAIAHKKQTGSVVGLAGTTNITNDELLHIECDVLIPAAFENQIRADNVRAVKAKVIAEAANGPTTPAADKVLFDRGIPVLPDILANSGGVTVSYFEWVQNIENEHWSEQHVNEHLREKMEAATDAVLQMQLEIKDQHGVSVDLRTAAFALAIKRVASVALVRGIWP